MSLRLRMLVVVVLALAALLVSGLSLAVIVRDSRAATIANVSAGIEAAAVALARSADVDPVRSPPQSAEARAAIRRYAASLLGPLTDTRGGYCYRDGDFVEAESGSFRRGGDDGPGPPRGAPGRGPRGGDDGPPGPGFTGGAGPGRAPRGDDDGPPGPPPDVRAALQAACRRAVVERVERQDVSAHGNTTLLFVVGANDEVAAFAMRIVPAARDRGIVGWAVLVGLPLVTLVMVGVMIETMLALRRGVGDLGGTLARLEDDLRGEVARPRARELAQIADQLRSMAGRLADARDRERSLARQVAHQRRLGSLGRLVAGVAHEIRNPLTGIKLLLDGMRRRDLDPRTQREVQTCLRELTRLNDIVTAFLGVARDAQDEPAPFDAAALADERIAAAAAHAEARGVRAARRGSATAFGERNVVLQIVDNLLRNAIDASPPGGEVEIVVTDGEESAEITVVDSGEGVPEAMAESLFEPFVTSKPGGTGLGLWISYTAATSRGADLRYRREAGRTHFTLTLPRQP